MTVTEAPRGVVETAAAETEPVAPSGLAALVGSGDPRTIGKLFVGTSLLFLLVAGVAGVMAGFEAVDTTRFEVVGSGDYAQVYTLQTITGLFLVALPLMLGLATAIVPLQVGANTVAFPRASAAAYWVYLVSGGLIMAAYAVDGGPFGSENEGVALFLAALVALLVALSVATISVVTTVVALRAPGMSLRRTPLFSWSMLIAGPVWLLTLATLAGVQVLVYVDFTYGQQFLGGTAGIYERIRWVFWQPTLYAVAIPALGIIADVVPVFAQVRHKQHRAAMFLIGLFGALGFGAWAQAGATVGQGPVGETPWLYDGTWIAASVIVLLPLLGLLGLWTRTLASGRPRLASPLILAQVAGLLVVAGVAAGLGTMVEDFHLALTTWSTGQAYLVVIGTIVAGLAGVVFWAPKLYGALLPEGIGRLVAPLFLLGTAALVVPYGIAGILDQPAFATPSAVTVDDEAVETIDPAATAALAAGLDDADTIEGLNVVAAIGGVVVVAAGLLFGLGVLRMGLSRGRSAVGDDPWNGHTLEWATTSPPPVGNFATLPEIMSEAPVYDARHRAATVTTATTESAS